MSTQARVNGHQRTARLPAVIAWVWVGVTAKSPGKLMPVSLDGAEKNVLGELEGESHFARCPDANKWRRS